MDKKLIEQKRKEILSNAPSTSEYRSRMLEKSVQKQNEIDLRKSQKMCEYLDREHVRIHLFIHL